LAECGEHLEAAPPRQHEVEHNEIESLVIGEEEPFLARGRHMHLIAFGLEPFAKGLGDLPLVLHDQHPHGGQGYRGVRGTAPDKNVRNSSVASPPSRVMINGKALIPAHSWCGLGKGGCAMRRIMIWLFAVGTVIVGFGVPILATSESVPDREALARQLRGAWLPLESGMTLSRTEGVPISAKYEIDNGTFQLSVYTARGDRLSEVIVDYSVGTITKVDVLTDSGDLAAAHGHAEAMARATRTLEAATAEVVTTNPGFRAVSATPRQSDRHPVAEN